MKNLLARIREAGSFVAGLLIGLSIIFAVFATMVVSPSDWLTLWVFGAPVIFALGLALHVVVAPDRGRRRTIDPDPEGSPTGFVRLIHER